MDEIQFQIVMDDIVLALKEQGYNPYNQLSGYIKTKDPVYITRNRDARSVIQTLNMEQIKRYVRDMDYGARQWLN